MLMNRLEDVQTELLDLATDMDEMIDRVTIERELLQLELRTLQRQVKILRRAASDISHFKFTD